ncbi:MAG: UDP-N-acetylglucosamine 2-epimerase (hydrolyzing) [Clostridiales bacterium]|nr:UDP-N-acetylglucosamine 2-epimerase (hydrolyzing) [Clostridiales bacterium]
MIKVCVITATRAEYGLLYPIIEKVMKDEEMELQLVVSGTHLSKDFGLTVNEIKKDNVPISAEINILGDGESDMSVVMGTALIKFSEYLKTNKPDIAIILGDRYEMAAFGLALVNSNVPIAHLNGGEITEGALDDVYRHCLTKMSTLHFTNCELHKKHVIQMGEMPEYVYNTGDTCVDNIKNTNFFSKEEVYEYVNYDGAKKGIIVATYHPVTVTDDSLDQVRNLISAIQNFSDYYFVITKANADSGGNDINLLLEQYAAKSDNVFLVDSLGRRKYLSLLNQAEMLIGNSSSGIYEAPFFKIPTVNIGIRQQGRIQGPTVINCSTEVNDIVNAICFALSDEQKQRCSKNDNIFGDGTASEQIIKIIKEKIKKGLPAFKKFYEII